MFSLSRYVLVSLFLVSTATIALAQITMQWPTPDPNPSNPNNFRLAMTAGFSVVYPLNTNLPPQYRLYAQNGIARKRWLNPRGRQMFDIFYDTTEFPPGTLPHCSNMADPRTWDSRCIESIGLFWKRTGCPPDLNIPCSNNDRWNAYPGRDNISAFPSVSLWPCVMNNPPINNSCADIPGNYGTKGYTPIINKDKVNAIQLLPFDTNCTDAATCPPKTDTAALCHPNNLDDYVTGTSNSKVVQVDSSHWYMAFNAQIHCNFCDGKTASDKWRVMWATSTNGENWTVHPQILFRSVSETRQGPQTIPCTDPNGGQGGPCIGGLLVTDMFVDEGYFYMVFTDQPSGPAFMVRSQISTQSATGYTNWTIAANPLINGNYTWKPINLGERLDLTSLNAFKIMPSRKANPFVIKQTTIGRVFANSQANSSFRYIGVTADGEPNQPKEYQLWSTTNLSKPFTFESVINIPAYIALGAQGFEPAFTHYADNTSATPKIVGSGFDFWLVENQQGVMVTRRTAKLTGGIYGP